MSTDPWSAWLRQRRHGGDPTARDRIVRHVQQFRDKVLAGAHIEPGDTVLDVGCGDGLLGLAALDHVGGSGTVIFSDISEPLLDHCRKTADPDRGRFVHTGLPWLDGIGDEAVDVAMTRSVLIYVEDKAASFASLHRVLRPGGRLSIFEPINRFGHPEPEGVLWGFPVGSLADLAARVKQTYRRHQPDGDTMTGFDERDLLGLAEAAGFTELHLEYHADAGHDPSDIDLSTMLRTSPNPLVPTFGEILDEALGPAEREALLARMRERLGARHRRHAVAYLTARR